MRGAITGHVEHFERPAPGRIRKSTTLNEVTVYAELARSSLGPFLAPILNAPEPLHGSAEAPDTPLGRNQMRSQKSCWALDMVDLTFDKEVACCMDVKMGTRYATRGFEPQTRACSLACCDSLRQHFY